MARELGVSEGAQCRALPYLSAQHKERTRSRGVTRTSRPDSSGGQNRGVPWPWQRSATRLGVAMGVRWRVIARGSRGGADGGGGGCG